MQKSAVRAAFNSSRDKTEDRSKQPRVRGVGEARLRHTVLIAIRGWANTLDNNPQLFHFSIMSTPSSPNILARRKNVPTAKSDISLDRHIAKLHPYRVHNIPDPAGGMMVCYEFWKIGAKPGGMSMLQDKEIKRQCADITLRSNGTFNLSYYPDPSMGEPVQAVGLPISDLGRAVEDLLVAGFH